MNRRRQTQQRRLCIAITGALTAITCGTPTAPSAHSLASAWYASASARASAIAVTLAASSIAVNDTTRATAVVRDAVGRLLSGKHARVAWSSSNPTVATVSATGTVRAVAPGTANIVASTSGVQGSAVLTVTAALPPPDAIPAPVATLSVVVSPGTITVGSTANAQAVARDAQGNVIAGAAVSWHTSAPLVASVDASGVVRGLAPGTARIVAASSNVTGEATLTVLADSIPEPPPPLPPPTGSREPTDFALITEREFAQKVESGWLDRGDANFSILPVEDAPRADDRVGQALFPAGFVAGSGPINTYYNISGNIKRLYMGVWVRFSANWQGQEAGVNKIIFIWIDAKPNVFLNAQGVGSGPLTPSINLQNNVGGAVRLTPNIKPGATFTRGEWHYWEVLLTANTVGQRDGTVQWWLDGEEIGRYSGVGPARDASNRWEIISWNPTWGGAGGTVLQNMWQQIDYVRVSGRP